MSVLTRRPVYGADCHLSEHDYLLDSLNSPVYRVASGTVRLSTAFHATARYRPAIPTRP